MAQPAVAFSAAAQAILDGHIIRACFGVRMELQSETLHLCQGDTFTDNTGQTWLGLGALGTISGVQCGAEAVTAPLQLTVSGLLDDAGKGRLPSLARAIGDSNAEILGGTVTVYWLLFDQTTAKAIDLPYMLQVYQMGSASFAYDGASNSATLTIPADPLFGGKHIPPLNLVSDADQQARYPGDRIFERIGWKKTVVTQ
jgi:hypothetical protein